MAGFTDDLIFPDHGSYEFSDDIPAVAAGLQLPGLGSVLGLWWCHRKGLGRNKHAL